MEGVTGVEDVTEAAADRVAAEVMEEIYVSILTGHMEYQEPAQPQLIRL